MSANTSSLPVTLPRPHLPWWRRHQTKYILLSLVFVLPALINFAIFRYYPMLWAGWASLWDYSLLGGFKRFVGLDNYVRALTGDPLVLQSLGITLTFVLSKVPIQTALALALAVFANQDRPGMGMMRAIIFMPVVTSFIVVSIVWGMILNKDVGLLNGFLETFGQQRLGYLTDPNHALPVVILISIWKDVGYSVIILVAGLKGISSTFYEAAIVDGASRWQLFLHITLPLLRRALMFVVVTTTIASFQVFIPVFQLTQGGPNHATNVIVYYLYTQAFIFGGMGYASALSIILLLILLVVSVVQMRLLRSDD